MNAIRRFALPVIVVFGSLLAYGGVIAGIAASQGPDSSFEAGDEVGGGGETETDGLADGDDGDDTDAEATDAATPGADDGDEDGDADSGGEASTSTPLPTSCGSLFSASMRANIEGEGLVLNPSWADAPGSGLSLADANLGSQLSALPQLKCRWLTPGGGGEVGVDTTIASVTTAQADAVESRLASLGYSAISELGGTRYVWAVGATSEGYPQGESHIVRGGLWFATHWLNYGPSGYTADMIHNVFG